MSPPSVVSGQFCGEDGVAGVVGFGGRFCEAQLARKAEVEKSGSWLRLSKPKKKFRNDCDGPITIRHRRLPFVTVCDGPVTKSDNFLICDGVFRHKFQNFHHNFSSVHVHLPFRHKHDYSITISVTNCDGNKARHNLACVFVVR